MQIIENGLSDPDEDTANAAVEFLREYLLKKELPKKKGLKKDQGLVELKNVLKGLRLAESYQHPRISTVVTLFLKNVVHSVYQEFINSEGRAANVVFKGPIFDIHGFHRIQEQAKVSIS